MGMLIYAATPASNFMPSDYGLSENDIVQVIAVGGGGGGSVPGYNGGSGYQSSFGAYCTAQGGSGSINVSGGQGMFNGGSAHISSPYGAGGGAGGYVPGIILTGGSGEDAINVVLGSTSNYVQRSSPSGLAGCSGTQASSYSFSKGNGYGGIGGIAVNGKAGAYYGGGGGYGATAGGGGGGGGGYGAGGGGGVYTNTSPYVGGGGGSGFVKFATIELSLSDITSGVPVVVGGGGSGAYYGADGGDGTSTSGGFNGLTAIRGGYDNIAGGTATTAGGGGGAGGCVIVFW